MLENTGVRENRRFHIVDADGRRFNQMRDGTLVQVRPEYDAATERLALHFPDGTVAEGRVALGEEVTTDFYGRTVPGNAVEGPWSDALSGWLGRPLRLVHSEPGLAPARRRRRRGGAAPLRPHRRAGGARPTGRRPRAGGRPPLSDALRARWLRAARGGRLGEAAPAHRRGPGQDPR